MDGYSVSITLDEAREIIKKQKNKEKGAPVYFQNLTTLLVPLLPRFVEEGKSYLTIAIGCTGGKHRSVYVAERLGAWLGEQGEHANIGHRDIDRVR